MHPRTIFTRFLLIAFGIVACGFALAIWLAPSPGHPPDIEKALDDFVARYPDGTVNDIRVTHEDEKARSFAVDYRNKASGKDGKLDVQYVRSGDGKWEIRPDPPTKLP